MPSEYLYAVCRALHLGLGGDEKAKLFRTVKAARAFLRRQQVKSKEIPSEGFPWFEWPLPIIKSASQQAPVTFLRDWLRPEHVPEYEYRETTVEEMVESGTRQIDLQQTPWPTYYLDSDWRFAEIEKKAWGLAGHVLENTRSASFVVALWKAVSDFDILLGDLDRGIILRSWDMHRHIVKVCLRLMMARPHASSREFHHAEWVVRGLVNTYGREIDARTEHLERSIAKVNLRDPVTMVQAVQVNILHPSVEADGHHTAAERPIKAEYPNEGERSIQEAGPTLREALLTDQTSTKAHGPCESYRRALVTFNYPQVIDNEQV
jgi:hypothetical protein